MQYLMWFGFGAVWLKLAFNPAERFTWALENVLLLFAADEATHRL